MPRKVTPKKHVRHFIAEHREAANHMTQEGLAALLGVDKMTVSRWELNKTRVDMDTLQAIAEVLPGNMIGEDLLYDPNHPSPNRLLRTLAPDDRNHLLKTIKMHAKQEPSR